jgi:hypothetical protein
MVLAKIEQYISEGYLVEEKRGQAINGMSIFLFAPFRD